MLYDKIAKLMDARNAYILMCRVLASLTPSACFSAGMRLYWPYRDLDIEKVK
jgi:hypothetical protein